MRQIYCCSGDVFAQFVREGATEYLVARAFKYGGKKLSERQSVDFLKKLPVTDSSKNIVLIEMDNINHVSQSKEFSRKLLITGHGLKYYALSEPGRRLLSSLFPTVNINIQEFLEKSSVESYDLSVRKQSSELGGMALLKMHTSDQQYINRITESFREDASHYVETDAAELDTSSRLEEHLHSLPAYTVSATYEYFVEFMGSQRVPIGDLSYLYLAAFIFHNLRISVTGAKITDCLKAAESTLGSDKSLHDYWKFLSHDSGCTAIKDFDKKIESKSPVAHSFLFCSTLLKLCNIEYSNDSIYFSPDLLQERYTQDELVNGVFPALWFYGYKTGYTDIRDLITSDRSVLLDGTCLGNHLMTHAVAIPVKSRSQHERVLSFVATKPKYGAKRISDELSVPKNEIDKILKRNKLGNVAAREQYSKEFQVKY